MRRVVIGVSLACLGCGRSAIEPDALAEQSAGDSGFETMFGDTVPPAYTTTDTASSELGIRFQCDVSGQISAVRFYRYVPSQNGYLVHLWAQTGELLDVGASIRDPDPVPGWQRVLLQTPYMCAPDTQYVASYFAPTGMYAVEQSAMDGVVHSGDLTGLINGVFQYGDGATFPTETFQNSNYFVDVEFTPE